MVIVNLEYAPIKQILQSTILINRQLLGETVHKGYKFFHFWNFEIILYRKVKERKRGVIFLKKIF